MISCSNQGILKWVPVAVTSQPSLSRVTTGASGLTFSVDILAHTTDPPVLDRPVTTIDVEKSIIEDQRTAQEQGQSGDSTAGAWWRPAAGKAAPTGLRNGLQPPHVFVHGVSVGHVGGREWWLAEGRHGFEMGCCRVERAQELLFEAGIRIWGRSLPPASAGISIGADRRWQALASAVLQTGPTACLAVLCT